MLCELAHAFPPMVAKMLERDISLKRRFREETFSDILMAALVSLEHYGIRVDFPHEPTTGADMEWIFAAPNEPRGGRYLRILLQAKRAYYQPSKTGPGYWYYHHLDYKKGQQAQTLANAAVNAPGTLPLYIFYHSESAVASSTSAFPPVEGVNLHDAYRIAALVNGGCTRAQKHVTYWQNGFFPLSRLLCWPVAVTSPRDGDSDGETAYFVGPLRATMPDVAAGFHPDLVASRLRELVSGSGPDSASPGGERPEIEPVDFIPPDVLRSLRGELTDEDRNQLQRPRVVLSTTLKRDEAKLPW